LKEHERLDKQESENEERIKRTEQAIETLDKAAEKIDRFLKMQSPRMGQGKRSKEVKSNITDNESGKMTTSKGTIQGFNGVAAVDKKHQVVVDAQAFGEGQEHHTLAPVLESIESRLKCLGISDDIYATGTVVTADTGFANEKTCSIYTKIRSMLTCQINAFEVVIRSLLSKKIKYGKLHQDNKAKHSTHSKR